MQNIIKINSATSANKRESDDLTNSLNNKKIEMVSLSYFSQSNPLHGIHLPPAY